MHIPNDVVDTTWRTFVGAAELSFIGAAVLSLQAAKHKVAARTHADKHFA
jgi:hypothetical protein